MINLDRNKKQFNFGLKSVASRAGLYSAEILLPGRLLLTYHNYTHIRAVS